MCEHCWIGYGSPGRDELPPEHEYFGQLCQRIYDASPVGSPLHTVLDDWNLADRHLVVYAGEDGPAALACAEEVVALMRDWTLRQRAAALAWVQGML